MALGHCYGTKVNLRFRDVFHQLGFAGFSEREVSTSRLSDFRNLSISYKQIIALLVQTVCIIRTYRLFAHG